MILEWFLTTRTAATNPRISIFTLSLLKVRAVCLMFPNVCFLISRRWKKRSINSFHPCKLHPKESSSLEYEQNRMKVRYWKIVANEKCTPEIGEFSSAKNSFWANRAPKRLGVVLNRRNLDGLTILRKSKDYIQSFWRTEEEIAKKRPKKPKIVKNRSFLLFSYWIAIRNQPEY